MAVTNEQVAAYLASTPNLSDAQIVSAMAEYGVSPAQMASATGLSEGAIVSRVAETLPPGQNVNLGGTWVQPVYDSRGQGETLEQGPLKEVLVYKENQTTGDTYKQYSPTGELAGTNKFQEVGGLGQMLKETGQELGPIALAALTAGGAGGLLGSSLGLSGTAANVAGGALLGGGGAALTGGNVLKGALLGGGGAYVSSLLNAGVTDPDLLQAAYDADVAGGMVPEFGTNAAYDSFMQSAMTPAAQAAIEAQIANSSVAGMTPEQILAQGNMITDIASGNAMGPMTADELGQAFEEYMAQGGYTPVTTGQGALGSTVTTNTGTTTGAGAVEAGLGGLTAPQIANLIKAGVSIAGITGAVNAVSPSKTTVSPQATPTQGMPTYSPEYYQQLQQYYNAYLPQTPRDVVTPLQQWYNTKSGA